MIRKTIIAVTVIVLAFALLNCASGKYIQDTYSKGGYPSWHPTHKKTFNVQSTN